MLLFLLFLLALCFRFRNSPGTWLQDRCRALDSPSPELVGSTVIPSISGWGWGVKSKLSSLARMFTFIVQNACLVCISITFTWLLEIQLVRATRIWSLPSRNKNRTPRELSNLSTMKGEINPKAVQVPV